MLTLEEVWAELQRVKGLLLQHAWRHDAQSAPDPLTITTSAHAQQHAYDSATDHSGTLSWAKLNKTGSSLADLVTKVVTALTGGNWKLLYTDGSGDVIELALGADDRFLVSTGAASAPEMRALVAGDIPDVSATYQVVSEKAAVSGYAGLDGSGNAGDLYINVEGKGVIVDAANNKRLGMMKESGYDPEMRYLSSIAFAVRRVTAGTINAPDTSDLPFQLDGSGVLVLTENITMAASKTVDGVDVSAHTHTGAAGHGPQIAGASALSDIGIADNKMVQVDGPAAGAPANGEYAKWTANGLEGKSVAEVLTDVTAGGAKVANTTPSSFTQWAGKSGDARKVLIWDDGNSQAAWGYVQAFDVKTPSQIKTFSDGLTTREITDGAGTVTPSFTLTYESAAGCTALVVDVSSTGEEPDTGANYPDTLAAGAGDPYTAPTGEDVIDEEGTTVGSVVTFTATATVDSVANLTKTTTFTWLNRKYYGPDTKATALTTAEVLALDATGDGGSALDADYKGSWTVDADTNEYIWFAYRAALGGTPVFTIGGFEGGFSYIDAVNHTNDSGFTESYKLYRSDNHTLGSTLVTVS